MNTDQHIIFGSTEHLGGDLIGVLNKYLTQGWRVVQIAGSNLNGGFAILIERPKQKKKSCRRQSKT